MWQSSLADITTLGFAISLMTSAKITLVDCFCIFLFAMKTMISEIRGRSLVKLDQVACA
jgi:hypothetical protein